MTEAATINLRSAIDEITLAVAEPGKNDLSTEITEWTVAYLDRVHLTAGLTDDEVGGLIEAIVKGVLKRLEQIALGGGQIGSA
jgi:hypothetical protein